MRVSTDPTDPAYIDGRPRKVWLNDVEITGWIVADEFRRCVITEKGVMHGGVLIERFPVALEAEPVADHIEDVRDMVEAIAPVDNLAAPLAGNIEVRPVQSHKNKRRR